MIIKHLDEELGWLILKHKEINKSELALKYNIDRHTISRHIEKIEKLPKRKLRTCVLLKYYDTIKSK